MKRIFLYLVLTLASFGGYSQTTLSGVSGSGVTINVHFETEYQAVLDRGTALGYTLPSASQRVYQNKFCRCLKNVGIWTELDLLYIPATDGSSNYATLNWITPASYQLTLVNSPTFTTNQGFTGNGTTQYLSTNWISGTNGVNYTRNAASALTWINSNVSSDNQIDFGNDNEAGNTQNFMMIAKRTSVSVVRYRVNNGTIIDVSIPSATSVGLHHLQRTGASAAAIFKNGASLGTSAESSSALPTTQTLFLLARNDGGGTPASYSTRQMSMFAVGSDLSGLESAFYTCWNTYKTAIGL